MHCPTLKDLPLPPSGKTGWPWTEESPQLPDTMLDGSPWPKISIVTPSLNQGQFIEETIRSVLAQGYTNLEYIIIDGGSNDGSVDIIKKYEKWLTYWVSEPDRGQSHAINKGFNLSKGEIVAWINSDDIYLPGIFEKLYKVFDQGADMVFGDCHVVNEDKKIIKIRNVPQVFDVDHLILQGNFIMQPSAFLRKTVFEDVGGLDESLEFAMDYDLWIRIGLKYKVKRIDVYLSCLRKHPHAKTYESNNPKQYHENLKIRKKYGGIKQTYQYYKNILISRVIVRRRI